MHKGAVCGKFFRAAAVCAQHRSAAEHVHGLVHGDNRYIGNFRQRVGQYTRKGEVRPVRRVRNGKHTVFFAKRGNLRSAVQPSKIIGRGEKQTARALFKPLFQPFPGDVFRFQSHKRQPGEKGKVHVSRKQYISARTRIRESGVHTRRRAAGEHIRGAAPVRFCKQFFRLRYNAVRRKQIVQPRKFCQVVFRACEKSAALSAVTGHMKADFILFIKQKHRLIQRRLWIQRLFFLHQSFLTGFMVGNNSTSLMLAWSVKNITILSTPIPSPPVGGSPYMSALT